MTMLILGQPCFSDADGLKRYAVTGQLKIFRKAYANIKNAGDIYTHLREEYMAIVEAILEAGEQIYFINRSSLLSDETAEKWLLSMGCIPVGIPEALQGLPPTFPRDMAVFIPEVKLLLLNSKKLGLAKRPEGDWEATFSVFGEGGQDFIQERGIRYP